MDGDSNEERGLWVGVFNKERHVSSSIVSEAVPQGSSDGNDASDSDIFWDVSNDESNDESNDNEELEGAANGCKEEVVSGSVEVDATLGCSNVVDDTKGNWELDMAGEHADDNFGTEDDEGAKGNADGCIIGFMNPVCVVAAVGPFIIPTKCW